MFLTACNATIPLPSTVALPSVNLRFSGPISATANGPAGQCHLLEVDGQVTRFGFSSAEGADFGFGFTAAEEPASLVTLTVTSGGATYSVSGVAFAVSVDHRSITIDADLVGPTGTEHVKGTIGCP
jgi:hypothetical protein